MRTLIALIVLASITSAPLQAEISKVTLQWKPGSCTDQCELTLARRLTDQIGVGRVQIRAIEGQAEILWKANQPFDFHNLQSQLRQSKVKLEALTVQVRGTMKRIGSKMVLESLGDVTPFSLLSPAPPERYRANIERKTAALFPLIPELRARLMEAEDSQEIVTAEGNILIYDSTLPLNLVVQKISFSSR